MTKKIEMLNGAGEILHPQTQADCVILSSGTTVGFELGKDAEFTPVIAQDQSAFKVGTGLDTDYSANVKDGAYESLIFKGKSLVNIIDYNQRRFNEGNSFDSGVVTINARGEFYSNTFFLTPNNIKPSTDYFIIFNVFSNTYEHYVKLMSDDDKACCFDYALTIPAKTVGVYKMKLTSKSDLSSCRFLLRTFGYNNTDNGSCRYRVMVIEYQEGMEDWDIPYFEGICDVKMPILRNVGKNLLDPQTFIPLDKGAEYVRYEDGYVLANFTNANTHFFYKVDLTKLPKGMYTVIAKHEGERSYLGIQHIFKDGTKTWGKTQFNNDGSYTELGLYMQSTTNDPSLKVKAKIMLVANSDTTSPYENHKTNILRTSEEIVLRSLPNGVCDTYNARTGEYIKRIHEMTVNGNEYWAAQEPKGDNIKFGVTLLPKCAGVGSNSNFHCDKYRVGTLDKEAKQEQVMLYKHAATAELRITIAPNKLVTQDVSGLQAWLRENPLTIQYELEEPIVTVVEPSATPFAYANGHVILESGYDGYSLLPSLEYRAIVNQTGQLTRNDQVLQKHEKQMSSLESLLLNNLVETAYKRALLSFTVVTE